MYSGKAMMEICDIMQYNHNAHGKYTVCTLVIEVTRRCNIACAHCMRGNAENLDISDEYIDSIMSQVGIIYGLALTGGEVSLAPDRLRYILDSAKRHKVKIGRVVLTTNGIQKSAELRDIFEEFKEYAIIPQLTEIRISNDKFHTRENHFLKKDYLDRKRFYANNRKNKVSFQDVVSEGGLKRCGRCEKPKLDYRQAQTNTDYFQQYKDDLRMYYTAQENNLMKRPIRCNGKHICQICLTATGHILPIDCISFADEDNPEYYNGHVLDTIQGIIDREKNDPYFQTVGKFLSAIEDLGNIGSKITALSGTLGLGAIGNMTRISELVKVMEEIIGECRILIPAVKGSSAYEAHRAYFDKAIAIVERFDVSIFEKLYEIADARKGT